MMNRQMLPMQLHTADYSQKAKILRTRSRWSGRTWAALFAVALGTVLVLLATGQALAAV